MVGGFTNRQEGKKKKKKPKTSKLRMPNTINTLKRATIANRNSRGEICVRHLSDLNLIGSTVI